MIIEGNFKFILLLFLIFDEVLKDYKRIVSFLTLRELLAESEYSSFPQRISCLSNIHRLKLHFGFSNLV